MLLLSALAIDETEHRANNLKYWISSDRIIHKTLKLFHDIGTGFSTGKLMAKLDITRGMLENHTVCVKREPQ